MAVRRMNEICTTMALTLVFGVLLLHTCQGQDEPTVSAVTSPQTMATEEPKITQSPLDGSVTISTNPTNIPDTDANQVAGLFDATTQNAISDSTNEQARTSLATPEITTPIPDVSTAEVESSQSLLDDEPVLEDKRHRILQDTHTEPDADTGSATQTPVFVPLLVSGLILASVLIGLYVWKNHCHTKTSGMKLADESYMSDKENQGNTLVSVAPLNPPEDQEKPSLNGESLEAVKIQNPPAATNGHSTAKADTEL